MVDSASASAPALRVALVHYWLVGMRGGEKVLEELSRLFPEADIYTHVAEPENLSDQLRQHRIVESFISRLPGGRKHYQKYLPLMPRALEQLDLTGYDLVISSEAGPAKGVITDPDALHICYVHSPMRYIWDQYWVYQAQAGRLARLAMPLFAPALRRWDVTSAARVDHLIANSSFIARRIARAWGRKADVIFPPVNVDAFAPPTPPELPDDDAPYLYAGELISYKRPDLVVDACRELDRPLVVIGEGAARADLEARAGARTTFLGRVSFDDLKAAYRDCRALIFPGVEDFGIIPLELAASGRPVLAYGKGGALETIVPGTNGLHIAAQTVEAVSEAITTFETKAANGSLEEVFTPEAAMGWAETFSAPRFRREMIRYIADRMPEHWSPALREAVQARATAEEAQ